MAPLVPLAVRTGMWSAGGAQPPTHPLKIGTRSNPWHGPGPNTVSIILPPSVLPPLRFRPHSIFQHFTTSKKVNNTGY